MRVETARRSNQRRKRVACLFGGRVGAGLVGIAPSVGLTRRDTSQAHTRTFSAPDWSITIPDRSRGASEGLAGGDDRNCGEQEGEGQHIGLLRFTTVCKSSAKTRHGRGGGFYQQAPSSGNLFTTRRT